MKTATSNRIRSASIICGRLEPGARNAITDVPGVLVGNRTLVAGSDIRTGVTAILPHGGDLFKDKPRAAVDVLNGFGASFGLMYVEECGVVESPILLTNTFSVTTCARAATRYCLASNPDSGRDKATVHPVVMECNDGYLSDIQAFTVSEDDALSAIKNAGTEFEIGAVGAGTGMSAFGLKGGIGTASRKVREYILGALVLANFGVSGDLLLPDGRRVKAEAPRERDKGSVIVILATDAPFEDRQLRRIARRAGAGIAWSGSYWGHGSGDVFLAFTTANRTRSEPMRFLEERSIDEFFRAAAEATYEAVLDGLYAAESMTGFRGHQRRSLRELLEPR